MAVFSQDRRPPRGDEPMVSMDVSKHFQCCENGFERTVRRDCVTPYMRSKK